MNKEAYAAGATCSRANLEDLFQKKGFISPEMLMREINMLREFERAQPAIQVRLGARVRVTELPFLRWMLPPAIGLQSVP